MINPGKDSNGILGPHILEIVTEPNEWVNSYVIVEKDVEINSSNAYSPEHKEETGCVGSYSGGG